MSHVTIVRSSGQSFWVAVMYTCMLMYVVRLIALAKFRSARETSHQPAFINGCLTISHICLSFLSSARKLFLSNLLVAWRVEK